LKIIDNYPYWQEKEKLFDLEYFEKNLKNFQKKLEERYLYSFLSTEIKYSIKKDFNDFVTTYFNKIELDIKFSDIADIEFNENIIIFPFRNLAGIVFFTNQRKNFWNDFILSCQFKDKEKLLKIYWFRKELKWKLFVNLLCF